MPTLSSNTVLMLMLWSLLAPIILTFIPPPELWRVARLVWAVLAPVIFISSWNAMLDVINGYYDAESLWMPISSISLALSVGLGCASSLIYRRICPKKPRDTDEL